ncbi:MAG: universal stress protein [Gemmatimonadetes bacterium]|nr:universal stress protein [Gemmatimonadota bacterium]
MTSTLDARMQVVFATDLQARSRTLLGVAGDLARATPAAITLVHALEPRLGRGLTGPARQDLWNRAREEAESALNLQVRELADAGIEVTEPILALDEPADRAILQAVETRGADLIVAGSTAREGKGHRIGSTADRLLRTSPVPVLVLRGEPTVPFGSLALLTDFSPRSRRAHIAGVRALPTTDEAKVHLIHVGDETLRVLDVTYEERTLTEAIDETRTLSEALGLPEGRIQPRVEWGRDPLDVLLPVLVDDGYEVLVLGTHGHGGFRRALIGSVAMGLAQSAPCSVLVVPGEG